MSRKPPTTNSVAVQDDEELARAYDRALTLLEFRARSVMELRRKLKEKGIEKPIADRVIERLLDQKLLDDAEFARQFARNRVLGPGTSRLRIIQELGRKGVARDIAEEAVDALVETEGVDPAATVQRVAEKKWRALAKLDPMTRRRRLYAFLARRGFNPDEIREAIASLGEDAAIES